ncbi:MAG: T9SS type A sorting domain-containing protein [Bacteroidetes bacterium]|nr:T9SS type A sorting domain-containing protein [Bacteroidota bacterium]
MDINGFSKGIYLVSIITGEKRIMKKVIKQ